MGRGAQYDILLVSPTSVPGGAERALTSLARGLVEGGWRVRGALLSDGVLRGWLEEAGCPVEVIRLGRTRQIPRTTVGLAKIAHIAGSCQVVVGNQSKGHAIAGAAAYIARRPAIWWQHGVANESLIETTAARVRSDAIVCGSRFIAEAQVRATPQRRVKLIYYGVDVDQIRAQAGDPLVRQRLGDGPIVGMLARLQPWKGQELFLRAAKEVVSQCPTVTFVVVGGAILGTEGDYPEQLRVLAERLGISERVVFAGHQHDAYSWLRAFDVAVTASVGEPFGLVTVEAMALGRGVVGVRSGGTSEIIDDRVSGLLVPPDDHLAMSQAIVELLKSPGLRMQLGQAASERAELFRSELMVTRFSNLIREIVTTTRY